jgi:hypothetical protein
MDPHISHRHPQGSEPSGVASPSDIDRAVPILRVRCECQVCGAHSYAVAGLRLYGSCGNCGSIELVPLGTPGEPIIAAA